MAADEEVDAPYVTSLGVFLALFCFVLIIAAQAFYYHMERTETNAKAAEELAATYRDLRAQQEGQLHSYRHVDRDKQIVAIPIERAIELLTAAKESAK